MAAPDTKTMLMDAAEHQVRHKGADGFSYADLSKQVGIRKASIHYHYPAKSDLLTAILVRYDERVMELLDGYAAERPTAGQQLDGFIDLYRDGLQDGTLLCLCVAYTVSQDSLSDDTQRAITRFRARVKSWLEQSFQRARSDGSVAHIGTPELEAAAVHALVEGAQIAARISGELASYDAATQSFRNRLNRSETPVRRLPV